MGIEPVLSEKDTVGPTLNTSDNHLCIMKTANKKGEI